MSEPFLAEIRIFGFNFAPRNYAQCDGQTLSINQNQSLFSLLGTTFGGDGRSTFGLPDLRARTPLHVGSSDGVSHNWGQSSGEATHVLTPAEMPQHDHQLVGHTGNATSNAPGDRVPATASTAIYANPAAGTLTPMNVGAVPNAGGGQGHNNEQPFMVLNFCIALQGLFPSRN